MTDRRGAASVTLDTIMPKPIRRRGSVACPICGRKWWGHHEYRYRRHWRLVHGVRHTAFKRGSV